MNFEFIENANFEYDINFENIVEIEEKYNIIFPTVLKEYYQTYDNADIKDCCFKKCDHRFQISTIYGSWELETYIKEVFSEGFNNYIPFAEGKYGEYFCWEKNTHRVVLIHMYIKGRPLPIVDSVDEFFHILNDFIKTKKVPIIKSNQQEFQIIEEWGKIETQKEKSITEKINKERFEKSLPWRKKILKISLIILGIIGVISIPTFLLLITDSISVSASVEAWLLLSPIGSLFFICFFPIYLFIYFCLKKQEKKFKNQQDKEVYNKIS